MSDDPYIISRLKSLEEDGDLRPLRGWKEINDGVIRIDPWGPEGGTYDYPVITYDEYRATLFLLYRDGTGRPWIEVIPPYRPAEYITTDYFDNPGQYGIPGVTPMNMGADPTYAGDSYTGLGWRYKRGDEEPLGRVESHVEEARPLEETTPLFGPQEEPVLEPEHDPWDQSREGHWDPVGLRWVYDDPTMKSAGILDDEHTHTLGERRLAADQESSAADLKADLDEEVAGPLRSGHWDPTALRWVPDEPETSSVGRVLGEESTQVPVEGGGAGGSAEGEGGPPPLVEPPSPTDPWDQPREGQPTIMRSAGILDDENSEDTQDTGEGSATQEGVDPSVPFDPETTPTSVEGTAAAPFNVDSTTFEGSTARGFDPSSPLDRADPNLQSLDSSLFDLNAPGPTLDPALFDEAEPGPTLDPRLFDSNAPGPTLDPALFDLTSPGPTVDPALFDERSPGPTLDPGLLDHEAPGPTLDANRLDPSAPGDTLDKAQLEQASERPNSVEEPADAKGRGDTDPRPMEEPAAHPEPSTPRHDDHDDQLDVG